MIGKTLGPYEILDSLGAGGMGAVYLAHDSRLQRKVALKFVHDDQALDEASRTRLLREARSASSLNHPHICTIFDVSEDDGQAFIAMEYVEGKPLDELISPGGLPEETVVRIGIQMADALEHAHAQGIVHHDLKSANVMIHAEGGVKILDFGLAHPLRESELEATKTALATRTEETRIAGTLPYMAPELLKGERADRASDIWALGIVLYEAATGTRPFRGGTSAELSSAILREPPEELPEGFPPGMAAILARCLTKEPEQRYRRAGEIRAALEALQWGSTKGLSAPPAQRRLSSRAPSPRGKWALGLVAAAVLVTAGVLVWKLPLRDQLPSPRSMSRDPLARAGLDDSPLDVSTNVVAVLPFSVRGDSDLAYWREGMVTLLSASMDRAGDLRAVDANAVLSVIVQRELPAVLTPAAAEELAMSLGAGLYVQGEIVEAAGRIQGLASLYAVGNGMELSARSLMEDEGRMFDLADELATQLLVGREGGEGIHLTGLETNLEATKAYLEGESFRRRAENEQAMQAFQRAVAADSLFAQAWARLFRAAGVSQHMDVSRQALDRALALGERLSKRHRQVLQANRLFERGEFDRADALFRAVLGSHPDDAEAWFDLGDMYYHEAPLRGLPAQECLEPFERALRFGHPRDASLYMHLAGAYAFHGRQEEALFWLDETLSLSEGGFFAPISLTLRAFDSGSTEDQREALARLRETDEFLTWATAHNAISYLDDLPAAMQIAELFTDPTKSRDVQALGHAQLAYLLAGQGRWSEARNRLDQARSLDLSAGLEYGVLLHVAPFLSPPRTELESARERLGAWDAGSVPPSVDPHDWLDPHEGLHADLKAYLQGLVAVRLQDIAGLEACFAYLESDSHDQPELAIHFARAVRAVSLHAANRPEEALTLLDETGHVLPVDVAKKHSSPVFSQTFERYMHAEVLSKLGQDDAALRWYGTLDDLQSFFDIAYRAPSHLRRAEIHERQGRAQEALEQYERFVELWRNCDPELRPRVEEVERRIEDLEVAL